MTTNLKSSTTEVFLASYATGNPFEIDSGTKIKTATGVAIYGNNTAVFTLVNAGYISGPSDGVALNLGGVVENFGGGIYGPVGSAINIFGGPGTVTNSGIVAGLTGVVLSSGGTITNAASGNIEVVDGGAGDGVFIQGQSGTVTNSGRIRAVPEFFAGHVRNGVLLAAGGRVTNNIGGLIAGATYGVELTQGGSIVNYGQIFGMAAAVKTGVVAANIINHGVIGGSTPAGLGKNVGPAVILGAGGVFYNGGYTANGIYGTTYDTSALTLGYQGVAATGGTVVNFATIEGSGANAVQLNLGAKLTNGGKHDWVAFIEGIVGVTTTSASVISNFGTILGQNLSAATIFNPNALGVYLDGGHLTNGGPIDSSALIEGYNGVKVAAGGLVTNFGVIDGSGGYGGIGAYFTDGGLLANGSPGDQAALVEGYHGIKMTHASGTITNYGTIRSTGASRPQDFAVGLYSGGRVTNGAPAYTHALISGVNAVVLTAFGTVVNFGTIDGHSGYGVLLKTGGAVTNGGGVDRSALVEGYFAIVAKGLTTVSNFGTVISTAAYHYGVYLGAGGSVTNGSANNSTAVIEGYGGVQLEGASTGVNFGTIKGDGDAGGAGAALGNTSSLTNGSATHTGALVEGYTGVVTGIGGADTVTNFGTIDGQGGVAVQLGDPLATLAVEANCVFVGSVNGGGGTLELGSGVGTLTGLLVGGNVSVSGSMATTNFTNFGTVKVDPGASFTAAGNPTIAAGQGLILAGTLTEAGTLTIAGSLTTTGTLAGAGTLALTGGTTNFNSGTSLTIAKVTQSGGTANSGSTNLTYAGLWTQTAGTVSASAGDRLSFSGTGDTFAGTLVGAGTIAFVGGTDALTGTTLKAASVVINGGAVTLSGTIANTGVVTLTSPSLTIAAAGVTLTGAGSIALSSSATSKILGASSAATLTNAGNKIIGSGNLGGGLMKLVNQAGGTINGNQTTAGLTIDTGANAIANAGVIENTGAGGTTIASAVANTGTLMVTKGVLTLNGAVTGAGTVKIAGGAADFASTFTENVTFTSTTGVLELAKSQTYTGSVSGFSKAGTTSLDLVDIGFTAGTTKATYVGTTASGVLTVTDGTHTAKIALIGDYTAAVFTVSSDGHGGTTVVDPTKTAIGQPHAPLLGFIAAAAGFGARTGPVNATGETWRRADAALAAPRAHPA